MSTSNSSTSSGIGFPGLLTIVFITLKLVRFDGNPVNDWSWWWVLSPFWIVGGIVLLVVVCVLIYEAITD